VRLSRVARSAHPEGLRARRPARRTGEFPLPRLPPSLRQLFMMRGGDLLALQKILGHRTLAMSQKYAHLSPDYLRSAMERTARQPALQADAISTTSAQGGTIEPACAVSARRAVSSVGRSPDF
jgi:hypothetical protein